METRENIRPGRLLPVVIVVAVALSGLCLLFLMFFHRPPARSTRESVAERQASPPSDGLARDTVPLPPIVVSPVDPTVTTENVLSNQGPDCLPCAKRNGCLDPGQEGGSCDQLVGYATGCGPGVTERDICYRTLADVFTSKCAATLQETPCLCGTTDVIECMNGTATPNGPVFRDYACDFKTNDATVIYRDFRETIYGVGRANLLVQCLGGYGCGCFGN